MRDENEVNDIVSEFLADFETSGEEVLTRYINKYPDLADIISEHATIAQIFDSLPEIERTKEEELRLELRTASIVQNVLHERKSKTNPEVEAVSTRRIESIKEELEASGYTSRAAAEEIRLSDLILNKLDRRSVRPESIPIELCEKIAGLISRAAEDVAAYFKLSPIVGVEHFKASSAPTVSRQANFSDLVLWDPDMEEAAKNYWLSQTSTDSPL